MTRPAAAAGSSDAAEVSVLIAAPQRLRDSPRRWASTITSRRKPFHHRDAWAELPRASAATGTTPPAASPATRSYTRRSYGVGSAGAAARILQIVRSGSGPVCTRSTRSRAARSSSVADSASVVIRQPLVSRLTTAGGSAPPRSSVAGPGRTGRGRVAVVSASNSSAHRPAAAASMSSAQTGTSKTSSGTVVAGR